MHVKETLKRPDIQVKETNDTREKRHVLCVSNSTISQDEMQSTVQGHSGT